jgi:hypothetical protein
LNLEETKDNLNLDEIEVEKPVEREKLDELLLIQRQYSGSID